MFNVQSDVIAKTIMLAKKGRWSHAAIAAIAVASLSLSVMSVARAQGGEGTPKLEGIYNTTRNPATINRETPKPDAAFRNYPTWPKGGRLSRLQRRLSCRQHARMNPGSSGCPSRSQREELSPRMFAVNGARRRIRPS